MFTTQRWTEGSQINDCAKVDTDDLHAICGDQLYSSKPTRQTAGNMQLAAEDMNTEV